MTSKMVQVQKEGRVAMVQFDRQDHLNALSVDLIEELTETALSFRDQQELSVVILTGSEQAFSSGIDFHDPKLQSAIQAPLDQRRQLVAMGPRMCKAWTEMEQVTIAAIHQFCVGGGLSLAVSCDFRVMSDTGYLRLPELALGMNMSWQTLPKLVHLIGPAKTKKMVMLTEKINAEKALQWGLVEQIVAHQEVLSSAKTFAKKIADMPPMSVRMTKQTVNAITHALDHVSSYMDNDQFLFCQMTEDFSEGLSAFFEKRPPEFHGR
ncbi:enoyl-CoA hydratase/isomerase family protein [Deltaproteobacteria bacterium TL4]